MDQETEKEGEDKLKIESGGVMRMAVSGRCKDT